MKEDIKKENVGPMDIEAQSHTTPMRYTRSSPKPIQYLMQSQLLLLFYTMEVVLHPIVPHLAYHRDDVLSSVPS